jgi:hypothetical protein
VELLGDGDEVAHPSQVQYWTGSLLHAQRVFGIDTSRASIPAEEVLSIAALRAKL